MKTVFATRLFGRNKAPSTASSIYVAVVEQARLPVFYDALGVPDSVEGRYEMIVLHAFLVVRRLRELGDDGERLAQRLFDTMFADLDRNLRELGVGDLAVGRRIKKMAKGFYGRSKAYEDALSGDPAALEEAIDRNVYNTVEAPPGAVATLAAYLKQESASIDAAEPAGLLAGRLEFGVPPGRS